MRISLKYWCNQGSVLELAYNRDSKSRARKGLRVRIPPDLPKKTKSGGAVASAGPLQGQGREFESLSDYQYATIAQLVRAFAW